MELSDKIKNSINKELTSKFTFEECNRYSFVPLYIQNNEFYIVTDKNADKNSVIPFLQNKMNMSVKSAGVETSVFQGVLNFYRTLYQPVNKPEQTVKPEIPEKTEINNQTEVKPVKQVSSPKTKKIGEILVEEGLITEDQLNTALIECKKLKTPLGSALVKLDFITVEQLKHALSLQQGVDTVDTDQLNIDDKVLNLLTEDFIREKKAIPLKSDGKSLMVGMVNPNDKKVIDEITFITGLRVRVLLITYVEFQSCLATYYSQMKKETNEILQQIEQEVSDIEIEENLAKLVEKEIEDQGGNIAKFANQIITNAIEKKASDIHLEPRLNGYCVRYRIDGILKFELQLPEKVESSVITRFKVLSKMNITEHRRPQDGTFSLKFKGISYDFRINTLPVGTKEKMVIRVLAPAVTLSTGSKELKLAGARDIDIEKIKRMTSMPNGIILATGPTGSGKTTTLYSVLKSINDEKVNITTIEDPIEIRIDGINQSQTNVKAGITFATCLRAILRQDPDIILVGEIRDYETLEVSISAALTGHLVLSTLHTNSAAAAITRLLDMGAQSYLVSATLTGIIAQRLVRGLCPHCKEAYKPSLEEVKLIIPDSRNYEEFMNMTIYRPKGCPKCDNTGFIGRLGLYEILPICKEIKKLIARNASAVEIEEVAVSQGMTTLYQACLEHIIAGNTSVSEFVRVIGPVHD